MGWLATSLALTIAAQATAVAVLRQGTPVELETVAALTSKQARQGQRVPLRVTQDVIVDGLVLVPKGLEAVGEVRHLGERGMFGKPGRLEVQALFLELGGHRIRLDGAAFEKGNSRTAAVITTAILVGGVAGFISGSHAVLPERTPMRGWVYADAPISTGQTVSGPSR